MGVGDSTVSIEQFLKCSCHLTSTNYGYLIRGVLNVVSLCSRGVAFLFPDDFDHSLDAWDSSNSHLSIFSHWTTDRTPISRCHSHKDYWREIPLYSALRAGCISVGLDLWFANGDLVVSHDPPAREHKVTLDTIYLKPLLWMLRNHNTGSGKPEQRGQDEIPLAGVFSHDPSQTLTLVLHFKSDGDELLPYVMSHLQPLREAGYLTHFDGLNVVQRPITIVVSGNTQLQKATFNHTYRDIFFDAPLDKLDTILSTDQQTSIHYNVSDSYYASVDFYKAVGDLRRNQFSQKQLALIRNQINTAHKHGLKARYTGTPTWPRGLRNHVWHILVREGVDIIDVEDLREATRQDWRKHRSWLL